MANYFSRQMTPPRFPVSGPGIGGRSIKCERGSIVAGTAYLAGDTIQMFRLHPRFRVTGGFIKTDGMGTSVSITVGDADDIDRYFTSVSVATAGVIDTPAATGIDYLTTKYTDVFVTTSGATANGTGVLTVVLFGYIEEPA